MRQISSIPYLLGINRKITINGMEVITFLTLILVVLIGLGHFTCASYNVTDEKHLFKHLFDEHNSYIVPRDNSSVPVCVKIKSSILFLNDVNVKSQTFTARIYFELLWNDSILKWNISQYAGIEKVNVPYEWIWTPDICIAGSVNDFTDIGKKGITAIVHYTGSVIFWPVKVFTISCVVDIKQYPFDEQYCEIDLSSWTYDENFLQISPSQDYIDLSTLTPSGEWDIESVVAYVRTDTHNGLAYSHVIFPFKLHRRWQFVILTTLIPILCTSLLTVLCFCLPTESGERVGLSISIFLTLAVFMTISSEGLPETADGVSLLAAYVALQLGWSGLVIVLTVISLAITFKNNNEDIPWWLQKLVKCSCLIRTEDTKERNSLPIASEPQFERSKNVYDTSVSWKHVAISFNVLCFIMSIICQLFLNLWFLFRSIK